MSDWNTFIEQQTAGLAPGEFDANLTYLMPIRQGILGITGPDAGKFLQGQVTCDVRELAGAQTLLGAQCNIKGRMLLCFRALQSGSEQILLRVHEGLVAKGMASLGKYIVFSKATLSDLSDAYRHLGIDGPNASAVVKSLLGVEIAQDNHWQAVGDHKVIRIAADRYECWLAAQEAESLWLQLAERCTIASHHFWTLLNIRAGIGDITPETYETFTPQAINFQLVNGINFRKGCYTGQEIVARLHYRGTLKRHMYRFESTLVNNGLPSPGDLLKNSEGKSVGEVVLAACKSPTHCELLASVSDDERALIYLENNPQKLSLLSLPYAIPSENEGN